MTDRWFTAFRRDPDQSVADLISGRAGVGSSLRLDVPELLYQAFPPNLADERAQLDRALFSWLVGMRESYVEQVRRLSFPVYGKRVGDVLIALQLLDLPSARCRIRADLDTWLGWLMPLRIGPERDPALECLRLLTLGQPDRGHSALWLRCAADPRPEYLTVALAGLRRLPNQHNARRNQVLMLQALLRHAVRTQDEAATLSSFNQRFAVLRALFPRSPQHWDLVLGMALDGFREYYESEEYADNKSVFSPKDVPKFVRELADRLRNRRSAAPPGSSSSKLPVPKKQWERLRDDVFSGDHGPESLSGRLFEILEQNHRYAEATGVSHFFVRTLHNVGLPLLEKHNLGAENMNQFGRMIERAMVWEPANRHCWMLGADWFGAQGHRDGRESTLREMLRLFPHNEHARVELGRLLITLGQGHWDEAEHWLQQAMDRAPDSGHARVVMARLLALRNRHSDAEHILAEFLRQHPDNDTARRSLNRLRTGGNVADDGSAENTNRDLNGGAAPPVSRIGVLNELIRRGRLAREFSRAQIAGANGSFAETGLIRQETMKGDPLAGFYSQWLMPDETPDCPPHAWAWNACRRWQRPARPKEWQDLVARFPEAATETEFLHVLAMHLDRSGAAAKWRERYLTDANPAPRAVDIFMREAQDRLVPAGSDERARLALALMACAATPGSGEGLAIAA